MITLHLLYFSFSMPTAVNCQFFCARRMHQGTVNKEFKAAMKSSFSHWYADEVKQALDQGVSLDNLKVYLQASLIKPLHVNC